MTGQTRYYVYAALVRCRTSRLVLYVCSPCRKLRSIAKRFACNDLVLSCAKSELSRVINERLSSTYQIESQTNEIEQLCNIAVVQRAIETANR